jgi:C_GCAxxG_C_C family probable redox protein
MDKKEIGRSKQALAEEARKRASDYESQYHGCGQCTLLALQEVLGLEDEQVFKSASSLCGGIAFERKLCGALTTGLMVLGMMFGRANIQEGLPGILKGLMPAHKLMRRFEQEFGSTVCGEIMGGGTDQPSEEQLRDMIANPEAVEEMSREIIPKCAEVVGKTAAMVVEIINEES